MPADAAAARRLPIVINGHSRLPNTVDRSRELFSIIEMEPGGPDTEGVQSDPARQLLPLALSRPRDALIAARAVLADGPAPTTPRWRTRRPGSCCATAAISRAPSPSCGLGCGWPACPASPNVKLTCRPPSAPHLRGGPQPARAGLARPGGGRPRGELAGRVLMRRASSLQHLGRFHDAHEDLSRALPYLRRAGDTVWEARSLTQRAEAFSGSACPGAPRPTSPAPRSCSRPAGRTSSTPRPGTTSAWWP